MVVREIMKERVATCTPDAELMTVADVMKARDCGFLPVVDSRGIVVGAVTDRDICLAAAATRRPLARLSVKETMSHPVVSCFPDENVRVALATMVKRRVRRLPVLSKTGQLEGVLSIDDIVEASPRRGAPAAAEIVDAMKTIFARRGVEARS